MADSSTVARPYAKAIFEIARDTKNIQEWVFALQIFAVVSEDRAVKDFVSNPGVSLSQRVDLFSSILAHYTKKPTNDAVCNFLTTLAENQRLLTLADIYKQYVERCEEYAKTIEVKVISYSPLDKAQEEKLVARLSARLNRAVKLNVEIDKLLQGGAIIRAGHLVFDASVCTQIRKLGAELAS